MSKHHRENRKPAFADWMVRTSTLLDSRITGAVFTRDQHGGYTFTDSKGVKADFPPGTVLQVIREEPVVSEQALRLDAEKLRRDRAAAEREEVLDSRA